MVLFNTAYPFIHPKFNIFEKELEDTIAVVKLEDGRLRELARQMFRAWSETVGFLADTARLYPGVDFVLRPHPFEDEAPYRSLLADLPNVRVIQEGGSLKWIHRSRLLFHRFCSTAMEACFLGVEPVSIGWPEAPELEKVAMANDVSHRANTREEAHRLIDAALEEGGLEPTPQAAASRGATWTTGSTKSTETAPGAWPTPCSNRSAGAGVPRSGDRWKSCFSTTQRAGRSASAKPYSEPLPFRLRRLPENLENRTKQCSG